MSNTNANKKDKGKDFNVEYIGFITLITIYSKYWISISL